MKTQTNNIMIKYSSILFLMLIIACSSNAQLSKTIRDGVTNMTGNTNTRGNLSNTEIASGLKEALQQGINKGADKLSLTDGYFKNTAIKILMPNDVKQVEQKLRSMGLGAQVDKAILSMNRAAEMAAKESKPIFVNAIKSMTITDAISILKGSNSAATTYLKNTTSSQLTSTYKPIIQKALDQTQATKYWKDVFVTYNKIPMVTKVNPDLNAYVTQKALDGLFKVIADEELKIRTDPAARLTDILKKVFGH